MRTIFYPNNERGKGEYGWLSTRYSFSFADWYDETKMGFGTLRVLNDDVIAAGNGFGTHGHRDMEIITIVTKGAVRHEDSMGNKYVIQAGDVQVMSAGTGVRHSEYNNSNEESLELFQIWIEPKELSITPQYNQQSLDFAGTRNAIVELVGTNSLTINQDAAISYGSLKSGSSIPYALNNKEHSVYIFVIDGSLRVGDTVLNKRDAVGVIDTDELAIYAESEASFLVIEIGSV